MPDQPPLSFPDQPRSELDRALQDLVDRAGDVMHTQDRLRALLRATQSVVEPIELPAVLGRIIRAAVELVDAEFGALGVIAPDGGLEQFVHVGMPVEQADAIDHLPEGRGVLGALIDDPRPIRLPHLRDDPRSVGFPEGHPPMDGFLGVPIRVRDEVYGNLYLTNPRRGEFTSEDEELVTALAATAGFAIANARLFEESRTRELWTATAAQVAAALLGTAGAPALPILADELFARTAADRLCIVLPGEDALTVRVAEARGAGAAELAGVVLPAMSTTAGIVLESRESRTRNGGRTVDVPPDALAIVDGDAAGHTMFIALRSQASVWGVLVVGRRPGEPHFRSADVAIADDLASRVGLAMELADARESQQRAMLVEDRARIARDLHDHAIQQLFGAGLELQSLVATAHDDDMARRLQSTIATLDESIVQIRAVIFALRPVAASGPSIRQRVLDIAEGYTRSLPRPVTVSFSGPVDLVVTAALAEDVAAVVRELLTNAVKHAAADQVRLTVEAGDQVRIRVVDDGVGISGSGPRSGLANLAERAERYGGRLEVDSAPGRTRVEWVVPADDQAAAAGAGT